MGINRLGFVNYRSEKSYDIINEATTVNIVFTIGNEYRPSDFKQIDGQAVVGIPVTITATVAMDIALISIGDMFIKNEYPQMSFGAVLPQIPALLIRKLCDVSSRISKKVKRLQ